MHGSAVDQVAAQTNGQVIQSALFTLESQQVGQGLGGVQVPAVAGIDDRTVCGQGSCLCRTGYRMTHHQNICVAADDLCGIFQSFALGYRGVCRIVEPDQSAAQTQHCGLERHLGAGGRLIEQGRHDLVAACTGVNFGVIFDLFPQIHHLFPPRNRIVVQINQMRIR